MKKNNKLKIIIVTIIILLILFSLPYIFTQPNFIGFDFKDTGGIGDTIGGILGPFIAIIAAILTFMAFYIQYQANEQLKEDLKIERFENKFYELLKLHKANVDEMKMGNDINGRECFANMFRELRFIYKMCESHLRTSNLPYVYSYSSSQINESSIEFGYIPFQGHINKLGHYYRHLYQTAKFIIENEYFNPKGKYGYIKTLRAQLPEFEQLLLYYNSLAWFRNEWKELFVEYRLIKNISIPLADFDITPLELFKNEINEYKKKGIALFEHHE